MSGSGMAWTILKAYWGTLYPLNAASMIESSSQEKVDFLFFLTVALDIYHEWDYFKCNSDF